MCECAHMHVHVYVTACVFGWLCASICAFMCESVRTFARVNKHCVRIMSKRAPCVRKFMCVCVCVCVQACMHACMREMDFTHVIRFNSLATTHISKYATYSE
jgi:hypothetical protein